VLNEHRMSDEHRSYVERWLDEGSKEAYRDAYASAFASDSPEARLDSENP
jgi:hypothetical protein